MDGNFTVWLGFGKLVTSLTMTAFYVMLFLLHKSLFSSKSRSVMGVSVYALALLRVRLFARIQMAEEDYVILSWKQEEDAFQ